MYKNVCEFSFLPFQPLITEIFQNPYCMPKLNTITLFLLTDTPMKGMNNL